LDDYLHLTRESILPREITQEEVDGGQDWGYLLELTDVLDQAAGIRTTSLVARDHLGEERTETETPVVTATHLRRAFSSPFWPFVLTSTSVGQEGLDFHPYYHAIMHWNLPGNPWKAMFDAAAPARSGNDSELVPYWIYPGRSKIERHVPMLPMSREVGQLARLKRDVARYRLVFGQPRQDDLLEYLGDVPEEKLAELRIDLSPSRTSEPEDIVQS